MLALLGATGCGSGSSTSKSTAATTSTTRPSHLPTTASGAYLSEQAQNNIADYAVCKRADSVLTDDAKVESDVNGTRRTSLAQTEQDNTTYSTDLTELSGDLLADTDKLGAKFRTAVGTSLSTSVDLSKGTTGNQIGYGPFIGDGLLKVCVASGYRAIHHPPSAPVSPPTTYAVATPTAPANQYLSTLTVGVNNGDFGVCEEDGLIQPDYAAVVSHSTSANISALEQDDVDFKNDILGDPDQLANQFQQALREFAGTQAIVSTNAAAENAFRQLFSRILDICKANGYTGPPTP